MKRTGRRILASGASEAAKHRVTAPLVPVRHEMYRDEAFTPMKPTGGNSSATLPGYAGLAAASDADVVVAYLVFQGHGPVHEVKRKVADMAETWVKSVAKVVRDSRRGDLAPSR